MQIPLAVPLSHRWAIRVMEMKQDQIEAIRMAILAALMHHKPDYRSPARLDHAAKVIGDFVVGALDDLNAKMEQG